MKHLFLLVHSLLLCALPILFGCGGGPAHAGDKPLHDAFSGGADTAGGDLHNPDYGVAWYLGERVVHYCLEVDDHFGVEKTTVEATVSDVLQTWKNYIQAKGANSESFLKPDLLLAIDYERLAQCNGAEDLKLYFGTSSPEVEAAKKKFDHPISFAYRTGYDQKAGWAKGFIWMAIRNSLFEGKAPDWHKPYTLRGMLLHEMGHVFGCPHVSGTIMDANLAIGVTAESESDLKRWFSDIDLSQELMLCEAYCEHSYPGRLGVLWEIPDDIQLNRLFHRLMNRDRVGIIKSEARYRGVTLPTGKFENQFTLNISDQVGSVDFPLTFKGDVMAFAGSNNVFFRFREHLVEGKTTWTYTSSPTGGRLGFANLKAVDGKIYSILVERNWGSTFEKGDQIIGLASPLRMDLIEGAERIPLFGSFGVGEP